MKNSKQGLYKEYTDKERFLFRQHASVYDTASALTKSKKCFPKLIRGSHPKKVCQFTTWTPHSARRKV